MTEIKNREIRLRRRPQGMPQEDDFELVELPVPEAGPSQVLVRNVYMSVDPYMRGRMNERRSYAPSFEIGQTLYGGCVGQIVASRNDRYRVGDFFYSNYGWREYFVSDGRGLMPIDPTLAPIQAFLGPLGMPGLTAYYGLLDIGRPEEGQTIFVSAASGAVGSIACQIAKLKGCRVVGSAGSPEKVAWLLEAGIDAAFNYKEAGSLPAELAKHCPAGIDIYFENVGSPFLDAALLNMNPFGRIVLCGMIAHYNALEPLPGPRYLPLAVSKRLLLQGFIISDHYDRLPSFYADMGQWIKTGQITWRETIMEGIEDAPKALKKLFSGENFGKMLVQIGPDPTLTNST